MTRILPLTPQMSSAGACATPSSSGVPLRRIPRRQIHCIIPSSPWLADSKTNIPLGVLYIAGLLQAQGHDVVVTSRLDAHDHGPITFSPAALACDLHLIGFCTPQFGEALAIAAYLKDQCPGALVVAGGPHPSYEPREVKEAGRQDQYYTRGVLHARRDYRAHDGRPLFDAVVILEAEHAILQLLTDWDAGVLQPYYHGDRLDALDLDAIPFPALDLLPRDHLYNDGLPVMKHLYFPNAQYPDASSGVLSLIGTRGCPYKCTYCSTPLIGQAPRYRSPDNILAEMARGMAYGIRQFRFQDDTYTLHRTKLRTLSHVLFDAFGPDTYVTRMHTRVNTLDDDTAASLARMNCRVCCFGIESGSQQVLDANQKGTTVAQNTQALTIAKAHGFTTIAYLVLGMSGETRETAQETQRWLRSVKPYLDHAAVSLGVPYPGSRWWTHPAESGIDILDYNYDNQWLVGFAARDEILVRPHGCTVAEMFQIKADMHTFMVAEGWKRSEWDADVKLRQAQDLAACPG